MLSEPLKLFNQIPITDEWRGDGIIMAADLLKMKEHFEQTTPKCNCGADGLPDHECPFALEIHNSDKPCNCCDYCTTQCAMDI